MRTSIRRGMIQVAALALCAAIVLPAAGQSQQDLRRENEALRAQVTDLQKELEAAQARIRILEAEVQRLSDLARRLTSGGGTGNTSQNQTPPTQPERVTIDESKPEASPRAMRKALTASYEEAAIEVPDPGDRLFRAAITRLNRWATSVNSKFRSSFEWHIRLDQKEIIQNIYAITATAVDPVTHTELGEPFSIRIPRTRALVLEQPGQENLKVVVLKGVLTPTVTINENRPTSGPFDKPPLLGPYAEFGFALDQLTITPPPPPADAGRTG